MAAKSNKKRKADYKVLIDSCDDGASMADAEPPHPIIEKIRSAFNVLVDFFVHLKTVGK